MLDLLQNAYFFIAEPLSYDFMQRALLVSIAIGLTCSIFSCFLVLKGWSLMGDAMSHAVLPGLALAYIAGIPLSIGAFLASLGCATAIGFLKNNTRIKEDALMGIVFSGMFAFGLVLMTSIETGVHLMHVLFGNILGITNSDFIETISIAIICSTIMFLMRKDLMLYCFDSTYAHIIGLPSRLLHFGLLILLSLTIVSSLKSVGVILVVAMLITPGATGFLLSRSFNKMMVIAICVSIFSCTAGTIASFHFDVDTAPLIVIIQAIIFLIALLMKNRKYPHVQTIKNATYL